MTSPALHIKQSNGEIYYVMLVPVDGQIMDAVENIIIDVAPINTCISYELPAGIYRVELQGGAGGMPSRCNAGTGKQHFPGNYVSSFFKTNSPTTIYALRGGDGNNAPTISSHQVSGGGASVSSNYKKGINGGDGGSGSTGTSEISFIRIYKI